MTNNHAVAYFSGKLENYDQILRFLTEYEISTAAENDLIVIEMSYEMAQLVSNDTVAGMLELQIAFPDLDDNRLAIYRRVNP